MDGKVIGITGGASGIGLALSKILVSRGAKISIADVSTENLQKAVESIKQATPAAEVITSQCDVRKPDDVQSWIKKTVDQFGKLDGAANMAGVISKKEFASEMIWEETESDWEFVLGVNLYVRLTSLYTRSQSHRLT